MRLMSRLRCYERRPRPAFVSACTRGLRRSAVAPERLFPRIALPHAAAKQQSAQKRWGWGQNRRQKTALLKNGALFSQRSPLGRHLSKICLVTSEFFLLSGRQRYAAVQNVDAALENRVQQLLVRRLCVLFLRPLRQSL